MPAFSVGRTQELVYDLHILAREGKIPEIPIYIDSPLAIDATTVFAMHPEIFDKTEDLVQKVQELFKFPLVRYTREASESKALNSQHGPMVIIAASGMAEAGRKTGSRASPSRLAMRRLRPSPTPSPQAARAISGMT